MTRAARPLLQVCNNLLGTLIYFADPDEVLYIQNLVRARAITSELLAPQPEIAPAPESAP
jgi:hypothetical protein